MAYFGMTRRAQVSGGAENARATTLALRDAQARALPPSVVAFGNLLSDDKQTVEGFAYFMDVASEAEAMAIMNADPMVQDSLEQVAFLSRWKRAFGAHQSEVPARSGSTGLLFLGYGKPGIHPKRDTLLDAHLEYLSRWDNDTIVARGALFPPDRDMWVGSVIAFELPNRTAFDTYFRSEPFVLGDLYEKTLVMPWVRSTSSDAA